MRDKNSTSLIKAHIKEMKSHRASVLILLKFGIMLLILFGNSVKFYWIDLLQLLQQLQLLHLYCIRSSIMQMVGPQAMLACYLS